MSGPLDPAAIAMGWVLSVGKFEFGTWDVQFRDQEHSIFNIFSRDFPEVRENLNFPKSVQKRQCWIALELQHELIAEFFRRMDYTFPSLPGPEIDRTSTDANPALNVIFSKAGASFARTDRGQRSQGNVGGT